MAVISLGKINKNIISIIVGSIFCFLNRILNNYQGTILFKHIIITNIIIGISKLFTVIPFIILKIRTKNIYNTDIQNNNNNAQLVHKNDKIIKIKDKWLYILLSAIIHFVQATLFIYTISLQTNYWIWDIVFASFLYYLICKIKLYKHHYLCIVIIILIGLSIDLALGNIQNDISNNISMFLLRFLREILFSLHDVVIKYIIEKKYVSVYEISLSNGISNTLLFFIFAIFDYYFFHLDDFGEYFNNFNSTELLVAIGVLITQLGLYLSAVFTIKNYTPCHDFIIFIFGQLAHYINFSTQSIIIFICFIFILFLSLIFNEIIELNFCGLSDNIKRNISLRAENEDFDIGEGFKIDTKDDNYTFQLDETEKGDNDSQ